MEGTSPNVALRSGINEEKLTELKRRLGFSWAQMARYLSISRSTIHRMRTGDGRTMPMIQDQVIESMRFQGMICDDEISITGHCCARCEREMETSTSDGGWLLYGKCPNCERSMVWTHPDRRKGR